MCGVYENPRQQHNCGLTAKGCSSAAVNKEAMRLATCSRDAQWPDSPVRAVSVAEPDRPRAWRQRRRDKCPDSLTLMLLGDIASEAG